MVRAFLIMRLEVLQGKRYKPLSALVFWLTFSRNDAYSLFDDNKLIRRNSLHLFHESIGPANFQIYSRLSSQAKVQSGIVHRIEARLTQNFLRLNFFPVSSQYSSPNGAAIGFCSY